MKEWIRFNLIHLFHLLISVIKSVLANLFEFAKNINKGNYFKGPDTIKYVWFEHYASLHTAAKALENLFLVILWRGSWMHFSLL